MPLNSPAEHIPGFEYRATARIGKPDVPRNRCSIAPRTPPPTFYSVTCFYVDVEVDGVAAIACGAGGTLHIVWRVERFPPIRSFGYKIGTPNTVATQVGDQATISRPLPVDVG